MINQDFSDIADSNSPASSPILLQDDGSESEEESQNQQRLPNNTPNNKYKYGIIYFSYIPDGINVKILREMMEEFGEVGRIFLESEKNNKKHRTYTEGWVEFKKKRVAKAVAKKLNGTALQYGRKHSKINGQVWSIKYLHRFKWAHLTEQMAQDRATRDQKRRFEMGHAKKQVEFYQQMTERSRRLKKSNSKTDKVPLDKPTADKLKNIDSKQNKPISEGQEMAVTVNEDLLSSIFRKVA